jgi:hypothetical protein
MEWEHYEETQVESELKSTYFLFTDRGFCHAGGYHRHIVIDGGGEGRAEIKLCGGQLQPTTCSPSHFKRQNGPQFFDF